MFMNDMFMNDFGAAYPIIVSVIQRVPDHRNARQVTSDQELKAGLDTRIQGDAVSVVAIAPPRRYSVPRTWPLDHAPEKAAKSAQCCAATVVGSKEKPAWSNIREVSPGTS
jgi:hypothetical protein